MVSSYPRSGPDAVRCARALDDSKPREVTMDALLADVIADGRDSRVDRLPELIRSRCGVVPDDVADGSLRLEATPPFSTLLSPLARMRGPRANFRQPGHPPLRRAGPSRPPRREVARAVWLLPPRSLGRGRGQDRWHGGVLRSRRRPQPRPRRPRRSLRARRCPTGTSQAPRTLRRAGPDRPMADVAREGGTEVGLELCAVAMFVSQRWSMMLRRHVSREEIEAVLEGNEVIEVYEHDDPVRCVLLGQVDERPPCTSWSQRMTWWKPPSYHRCTNLMRITARMPPVVPPAQGAVRWRVPSSRPRPAARNSRRSSPRRRA